MIQPLARMQGLIWLIPSHAMGIERFQAVEAHLVTATNQEWLRVDGAGGSVSEMFQTGRIPSKSS